MLIGVDGFELTAPERVGVGRLVVELIRGLQNIDRDNRYRVYVPNRSGRLVAGTARWTIRKTEFNRLWSQAALPFYLYLDNPEPDVFLSPSHYLPRFSPCPGVNFVFDLSYIHYPEMFKHADLYKLRNWTEYSVKKADRVVTISEASRADIIDYYNLRSDKIKVVYPGAKKKSKIRNPKSKIMSKEENGNESAKKLSGNEVFAKYGIGKNYILYVGTLQPRKNLVRLIEAFHSIINHQSSIINHQLVIAGKKGWMYDEIFEKVKVLNLEENVRFTGFVPDEELQILYRNAKLLSLVSLYEGFGLPVLEAMSYGTPVVVSGTSSLPEAAGDAGIYVDPEDVESISEGLSKVLSMEASEYAELSEECKKQASKFSWKKTAEQVLQVLKETAIKH